MLFFIIPGVDATTNVGIVSRVCCELLESLADVQRRFRSGEDISALSESVLQSLDNINFSDVETRIVPNKDNKLVLCIR